MTQALGQFVKTTNNVFSDKYEARAAADGERPLLVWVREYKAGLKTVHSPNGDGEGVVVDLIDLGQFSADPVNSVYCNVLWMGSAVRDQLKAYAGGDQAQPLPIKLAWQQPQGKGMKFVSPEQLDDDWLAFANQVFQQYPTFAADVKAKKKAEWEAANPTQVPQVPAAIPGVQALAGPAPVAQQAVAPPAPQVPQAPVQQAPQAPVAAPAMQAPVAAPQAPQVPVAPTAPAMPQAPVMQAPGQPPAAPQAVPPVTDLTVEQMMAQLDAQ